MVKIEVGGKVVAVGDSRDKNTHYVAVKCYDDSDFSLSVLKVPLSVDLSVGDDVIFDCTVRAFYRDGKSRVCYFYKNHLK